MDLADFEKWAGNGIMMNNKNLMNFHAIFGVFGDGLDVNT